MGDLSFKFGDLTVVIVALALETMDSYRQTGFFKREAGGQMFARLQPKLWRIEVVTGPRRGDRRGRFHFWPDRKAEQEEIDRYYGEGLDFVGDWHTHPEDVPSPSRSDVRSVENVVRESIHDRPGILMCIVGRKTFPDGLWLSFHSK
jgi:integrative and conjugative element protein (TIGR02256 family)